MKKIIIIIKLLPAKFAYPWMPYHPIYSADNREYLHCMCLLYLFRIKVLKNDFIKYKIDAILDQYVLIMN